MTVPTNFTTAGNKRVCSSLWTRNFISTCSV